MKLSILIILQITAFVLATEEAVKEFTNGNNLFAGRVYTEAQKDKEGNFLISPFSIQTVMALTQSGAKGETAEEIRNSLHLPKTTKYTESAFADLLPTLRGNDRYILKTANKIYVKKGYPLNDDFNSLARSVYQSGIENLDFSHKEYAAETINSWVGQQTENKIKDLIEPKTLQDNTRVVLINALYFKGKWKTPFETYATNQKDFYRTPQDVVQVDTMHNTDLYNYYESKELNAKFLELPYQGEEVSMVIVLPNAKDGLAELEKYSDKIYTVPTFTQERVSVALPKFAIENKVGLKEVLKNLGVKKAFTEDADLSGMAGRKGDVFISDVIQKAFINVTEAGTEAAAASAVIGTDRIGNFDIPALIYDFKANHPFLFYLKLKGNIVMFNGRISSPE